MNNEDVLEDGKVREALKVELSLAQLEKILAQFQGGEGGPNKFDRLDKALRLAGFVLVGLWAALAAVVFDWQSKKLELELARAALEKHASDMESARQTRALAVKEYEFRDKPRIKLSYTLSVLPAVPGESFRMVDFVYRIENLSQGEVKISAAATYWYKGSLKPSSEAEYLELLNGPTEQGPIAWRRQGYSAFLVGKEKKDTYWKDRPIAFGGAGGGTGTYRQGEVNLIKAPFVARVDPGDWIGFAVEIGTGEALRDEDIYHIIAWKRVPPDVGNTSAPAAPADRKALPSGR